MLPGDPRLCPMCKGKEWLAYDVPVGHPLFREIVRCTVCGEGRQQAYLRDLCGLRGDMLEWTFANTTRNAANAEAYDVARELAQHPARLYTLLGDYGVGKTRLLACIINAGRAAGWVSIYTTTANLLDYLRGAYEAGASLKFDARWELLSTAQILAIDEFDRWSPTPWAREKFETLLNERYANGGQQLTAFAANAAMSDLPPYVRSRMSDSQCYLYRMSGQDVRRMKRGEQ